MLKVDSYTSDILKDITFTLENRNLIVLGNNGAGKTTLAKVLSGIIRSNSVKIDDQNPSQIFGSSRTKLINYIPAKMEVYDEFMSVEEFLDINKLYSTCSIDECLEILDISYIKDKICKNLSSGESQLLLIASAILHNAKYTIFDEPTSNLDPLKIKNTFGILKDDKLFQNKIIITHNLDLAYKLGYDVLFLKDGKVVFLGDNKTFFSQENLELFFKNSVKIAQNSIVVNL